MSRRDLLSRCLLCVAMIFVEQRMTFAADTQPRVGQAAEDFELISVDGVPVKLTGLLEKGPVVLVVLRGFPGQQCPVCNQQVGQLLNEAAKFKAAGASVVLVYPGPSEKLVERAKEFVRDKTIPDHFRLLLDPDFAFIKGYHLRWDAPGETAYPSTFVIQKNGKISFAKISQSHGGRSKPAEILEALK